MATLPTTRDENWRYADGAVLAALDPDVLEQWDDFDVPAGESARRTIKAGGAGPELIRVRVTVGDGATAELFAVVAGEAYARLEVVVSLGKAAHFQFGGVTIGGGDAVREIVTRMDHALPDATSDQVIRAVHWDSATGNFLGRIDVARHAQKTDAAQDFKGLLLERGAAANARPELEIYADDVKCAHGASIGQLDEQARFYMAARGLAPDVAKRLLVQAFIGDAFAALEDESEQARLMDIALAALGDRA
ncbi:SufD family Fe-S cluster assembly protein [Croceibacterium sp. TMG7-5b_MA50]|uniref:SufD family Fe-S cluster assembly protein n=1 Tax=Croceibacterium sp. TMG7-5b_MA50 TaxID=3121290 RepID=UPI00322155FF